MAHRSKKKHLKHIRRQERLQQAEPQSASPRRDEDERRERDVQRAPTRERHDGG